MLEASIIKEHSNDSTRIARCDNEGNLCVVPPISGAPFQFFLTTDGNGTGTISLNADYSSAPTDVFYTSSISRIDIYTLLICVSDNANFNQTDFGAIAGGLVNGIKFLVRFEDGITEVPILSTNIRPIKKNSDFLSLTAHSNLTTFNGTAQTLICDLNVEDEYGKPFALEKNQRLIARLNDNFSALTDFTIGIRGIRYT